MKRTRTFTSAEWRTLGDALAVVGIMHTPSALSTKAHALYSRLFELPTCRRPRRKARR